MQAGDAVLLHTGWGRLWGVDNAKYATRSPGIGVAAAEWLAKKDVLLFGADTGPVEILPNPDPQIDLPVHQIALVVNGIFLLENLEARSARRGARLRVRVRRAAAEDQGRHGIDRGANRDPVIGVAGSRGSLGSLGSLGSTLRPCDLATL